MIDRWRSGEDVIFFSAPAVVVVSVPDLGGLSFIDPTIAVTYGMLAAHTLGLGTCWMGFAIQSLSRHRGIKEELGLPMEELIAGIMTVGYPELQYRRPPARKKVECTWIEGGASRQVAEA